MEIRVIVWSCTDVPIQDASGCSDIYITCNLPTNICEHSQKTDTHWRSQNGFGSFNWRMIFKTKIDAYTEWDAFRLDVKAYDRDLLLPDDYLCMGGVKIGHVVKIAYENASRIHMADVDDKVEKGAGDKSFKVICRPNARKFNHNKDSQVVISVEALPYEQ